MTEDSTEVIRAEALDVIRKTMKSITEEYFENIEKLIEANRKADKWKHLCIATWVILGVGILAVILV